MANILSNTDGGLITADNSAVVFIDHQPQMTFGVANIERQQLVNNVVMLAKGAREFGVPAILTAVETESFSGYIWPQLMDVFPGTRWGLRRRHRLRLYNGSQGAAGRPESACHQKIGRHIPKVGHNQLICCS